MTDLSIKKIKTKNKDLVDPSPIPAVLPKHPARVLFSGASRSGKTNLLISLITDKRFYFKNGKPYFDIIFLFSGSALTDDVWLVTKKLIKPHHRFPTLNIKALDDIWTIQDSAVKQNGIHNAPKILLIMDDVIDNKNINDEVFKKCFYRGRHVGISIWVATQHYNKIPLSVRNQITNLFLFKPTARELKTIVNEITPAGLTEEQMKEIILEATAMPYNFLHVDFTADKNKIFRKNLDTILRFG